MKFVDEAIIQVESGKGGDGCLSFRRERFVPKGGPDGGDGGDGGSVFIAVDPNLNTLVNFRHQRLFRAHDGCPGMGKNKSGKSADDLYIPVPSGTLIYEHHSNELIDDLIQDSEPLKVAQGGHHGLGNARFKSSVNQAPRKTTKGHLGEKHTLRLELRVLADVGLLGLPNAGKSSFIRAISAAKPKVGNYPFTTRYPHLGIVKLDSHQTFTVADIPGLIRGAANGAGLGSIFLRHLSRTILLLHIVEPELEPEKMHNNINMIEDELLQYNHGLMNKQKWLVCNKCDILSPAMRKKMTETFKDRESVYFISSVTGEGCQTLVYAINEYLKTTHAHGKATAKN